MFNFKEYIGSLYNKLNFYDCIESKYEKTISKGLEISEYLFYLIVVALMLPASYIAGYARPYVEFYNKNIDKKVVKYELFQFAAFNVLVMSFYMVDYSLKIFSISILIYSIYLSLKTYRIMHITCEKQKKYKSYYDKFYDLIDIRLNNFDNNMNSKRMIYLLSSIFLFIALFIFNNFGISEFFKIANLIIMIVIYFHLDKAIKSKLWLN